MNIVAALLPAEPSLEQIEQIVTDVFHDQFDVHYKIAKLLDTDEYEKIASREVTGPPERKSIVKVIAHELHKLLNESGA